jgi:hypothetical protein
MWNRTDRKNSKARKLLAAAVVAGVVLVAPASCAGVRTGGCPAGSHPEQQGPMGFTCDKG